MLKKQRILSLVLFFAFLSCFFACSSVKELRADELSKLKDIGGYYNNKSDSSDTQVLDLISQFNLKDSVVGPIKIEFVSEKELSLEFNDGTKNVVKKFNGKYHDGYFEITVEKWAFGVPLIYFSSKLNRIWISKSSSEQLIIDRHTSWSGFIFVMSAGDSFDSQNFYSTIVTKR